MKNTPEFGGGGNPEDETALSRLHRHELLADLAKSRQESAGRQASDEVARNPELAAMLAQIIECGPELPPGKAAHLRRMIALSFVFYRHNQTASEAAMDEAFHTTVIDIVQQEIDQLNSIVGDEYAPDMWDIAYQDLLRFEGGDTPPNTPPPQPS